MVQPCTLSPFLRRSMSGILWRRATRAGTGEGRRRGRGIGVSTRGEGTGVVALDEVLDVRKVSTTCVRGKVKCVAGRGAAGADDHAEVAADVEGVLLRGGGTTDLGAYVDRVP